MTIRVAVFAIGLAVCAALVHGVFVYSESLLADGMMGCEPAVRASLPSPAATASAVVFEMGCGATVGFNTQVSIVPAGETFDPEIHRSFLALEGRRVVDMAWIDDERLSIVLPYHTGVYRAGQPEEGISVSYE